MDILFIGVAYLVGSIPVGLILARLKGVDVRTAGSGNIGATNVARTAGKALGLLTLVLDACKGAAPVLVGAMLGLTDGVLVLAGSAAIIGHVFPVYLKFRGGKGVATALGLFLSLSPIATSIAVVVFAAVFAIFRIVSVGSLVASLALLVGVFFFEHRIEVQVLAGCVVLLVFVRHAGNIRRLLQRDEHRV